MRRTAVVLRLLPFLVLAACSPEATNRPLDEEEEPGAGDGTPRDAASNKRDTAPAPSTPTKPVDAATGGTKADGGASQDVAAAPPDAAVDTTPPVDFGPEARPLPMGPITAPWEVAAIEIPPASPDGGAPAVDAAVGQSVMAMAGQDRGVFAVEGAGKGVRQSQSEDELALVYQTIDGDAEIMARLTSFESCMEGNAKAGVTFRQALTPDARNVTAAATFGMGLTVYVRPEPGERARQDFNLGGAPLPRWIRIVRKGATFTSGFSPDGMTWTETVTQAPSLPKSLKVGLFVSSGEKKDGRSEVCRAFFDTVRLRTTFLPAPWMDLDIGPVAVSGQTTIRTRPDRFTLQGSGEDLKQGSDSFYYLFQPGRGDVELTARLVSFTPGPGGYGAFPKVGLMIRQSLRPESVNAFMGIEPASDPTKANALFQMRRYTRDDTKPKQRAMSVTAPVWLRLVRGGDVYYGFYSRDGKAWTLVGRSNQGEAVNFQYLGFALVSSGTEAAQAEFDNLKVNAAPVIPDGGFQFPDAGVPAPPTDAGAPDAASGG